VHYGVPEGSYATDPDGAGRLREFRAMVQALNGHGLRVIVDVVYNHTFAAGADGPQSVLDKIVPGYYHRYSEHGHMEASTVRACPAAPGGWLGGTWAHRRGEGRGADGRRLTGAFLSAATTRRRRTS